MGFRFRKSINTGGGFRINLSKSGIGCSLGTKGARITKTAKGTTRSTLSVPGTGISYVNETSNAKNKTSAGKSKAVALFLCIFFGALGAHRFYVGKTGTGLLYLFTLGLFCIGWFVDIVQIARGAFTDAAGRPLEN